jgi:t-SNARE complex subunit (syntaxin)
MEINCQNSIEDQKEYIDFLLQSKEHGRELRVFVIIVMLIVQIIILIVLFLIAWILSLTSLQKADL